MILDSAPWAGYIVTISQKKKNIAKGNHLYKAYSGSVPSPIYTFLYKSVELTTTCFESKLYLKLFFTIR